MRATDRGDLVPFYRIARGMREGVAIVKVIIEAPIKVADEYRAEIARLRIERDILVELVVDGVQFQSGIGRDEAKNRVTHELFVRLKRASAL